MTKRKMIKGRKDTWFDFHIESLKLNGAPLCRHGKP